MTDTKPTIGFIGVGVMGEGMARNLLNKAFPLVVFDVRRHAVAAFERDGARAASTPAEAASQAEVVVTSLPMPAISEQVYLGPNGVLEGAKPNSVLIEASTIPASLARTVAAAAEAKGCFYLDAPVSGGEPRSRSGELAIMIGGDRAAFDRVRPVFDAIGTSISYVGGPGMGSVFKILNNALTHANLAAICEVLAIGARAGADPQLLFDVISKSSGTSNAWTRHVPRILERNFNPGMKTSLAYKDSGLAMQLGAETGVPMPVLSATHVSYEWAKSSGLADLDYSAMITLWEQMLGVEVVRPKS